MARGESPFADVPKVVQLPVPVEAPVLVPTIASTLPDEIRFREFIVKDLIPKRELTLFAGEPKIGKGWLMESLQVACAVERPWLRRATRKCRSLAIYSEDPEEELQGRLKPICRHYGADPKDLEEFVTWLDRKTDPMIWKGGGRFTISWKTLPLWQAIRRHIQDFGIELLILDNALTVAMLYDYDQHIKSFCRWLICEAEELDIAIVLLHHPPAEDRGGVKWYAGSANWARSVRNALVLQKIQRKPGDPRPWYEDDGRRVLIAPSNNYLPHDHPIKQRGIMLQWRDGVLQRTNE